MKLQVTAAFLSLALSVAAFGDELVKLRIVLPKSSDPELDAFVARWEKGKAHDPRGGESS